MTNFEEKLDKLELQNIKCREEIARLQKSLRKKNKSIKDLNEAVKNIKSERDEWKVDANQLDKEKDEFIIENEKLKSQLQQQALPVVPECVGIAIESLPDNYSAFEAISLIISKINALPEENEDWLPVYNWLCEGVENQDIFALAFITGKYQVEKPQQKRYEVKLLSGESMHFNPIGNPKNIKDYRFSFGNYAGWKTQFTKSELAEIEDGMFLKRIPGGTPLDDLVKDKSYYVWIEDCNYWINPLIELVPVEDGE